MYVYHKQTGRVHSCPFHKSWVIHSISRLTEAFSLLVWAVAMLWCGGCCNVFVLYIDVGMCWKETTPRPLVETGLWLFLQSILGDFKSTRILYLKSGEQKGNIWKNRILNSPCSAETPFNLAGCWNTFWKWWHHWNLLIWARLRNIYINIRDREWPAEVSEIECIENGKLVYILRCDLHKRLQIKSYKFWFENLIPCRVKSLHLWKLNRLFRKYCRSLIEKHLPVIYWNLTHTTPVRKKWKQRH